MDKDYQSISKIYKEMDSLIATYSDKLQPKTLFNYRYSKVSFSLNTGKLPLAKEQLSELKPLATTPYFKVLFFS